MATVRSEKSALKQPAESEGHGSSAEKSATVPPLHTAPLYGVPPKCLRCGKRLQLTPLGFCEPAIDAVNLAAGMGYCQPCLVEVISDFH